MKVLFKNKHGKVVSISQLSPTLTLYLTLDLLLTPTYKCHPTLTGCYQLAKSTLKIGSALEKGWDRGRLADLGTGYCARVDCCACMKSPW